MTCANNEWKLSKAIMVLTFYFFLMLFLTEHELLINHNKLFTWIVWIILELTVLPLIRLIYIRIIINCFRLLKYHH